MGLLQDIKQAWWNLTNLNVLLSDNAYRKRLEQGALRRDYYSGAHRRQFKVRANQPDDNLTVNFTGLIVKRGVAMLLGNGVEFDMPGDPTEDAEGNQVDPENQQYVDMVWKANKKDILLQKIAQFGAINGTCYVKIIPDGTEARDEENMLVPRFIPLDPLYIEIETDPEDIDTVLSYTNTFNIEWMGKSTARKEVVRRNYEAITDDDGRIIGTGETDSWTIEQWYSNNDTQGRWERLVPDEIWAYEFPPIIHWQNLPLAGSIYGEPDITDDVIEIQDRLNFIASNISKIIRYHSHPKTWGKGIGAGQSSASWGADEMVLFSGDNAGLSNLEMTSDLASSQAFLEFLRVSMFDIARTTDLSSFKDRIGQLTNFAVRVLFLDSSAKLGSKQEIYGEALQEINHRILVLADYAENDGGEIVWPDVLPTNEVEETQGLKFDLENKLLSKKTAATMRGYDYEQELERMEEERADEDNIGSMILRAFNRGQPTGFEQTGNQPGVRPTTERI